MSSLNKSKDKNEKEAKPKGGRAPSSSKTKTKTKTNKLELTGTQSQTHTQRIGHSHTWTVSKEKINDMFNGVHKDGDYVYDSTSAFQILGCSWVLQSEVLQKSTTDNKESSTVNLSLFLKNVSSESKTVAIELSMTMATHKVVRGLLAHKYEPSSSWGSTKFLTKTKFEELYQQCSQPVIFKVTIFEEFTQPGLVVGHKSDHASTWEALWNDKTFTDITLVSNDQITFHFHKAVLAAVSPIFRTMLSSSFKEAKENRIDIHFSRSIIYSAMRWIYLGETQSVGKLTSEEAVSLLQFCIMYEMFELADVAIAQIVNMLTCANLKQISQLADLHAEATNALLQPLIERLRTEIDFFISTHSDDLVKQWMKDAPASVSASGKRRADTESTKPEIKRLKASNSLEEID